MASFCSQLTCNLERSDQMDKPVRPIKYETEKCVDWIQSLPKKASHAVSLCYQPHGAWNRFVALAVIPMQIHGPTGMGFGRNGWPDCIRSDNEIRAVSQATSKECLPASYSTSGAGCHGDGAHDRTFDSRLT